MDGLFELKRRELTEQGDYKKLIPWCNAHLKLLSCFDEGCDSFYASHKFWICEAKARAYKHLGDKSSCLAELKQLKDIATAFDPNVRSEDFQIGVRNPLFFSTVTDPGTQEEYMSETDLGLILSEYEDFFGDDDSYKTYITEC